MNNSVPLVSVIIPCYNEEDYILGSINSILSQDYKSIEIVVIDDNSTDATVEKINSLNNNKINLIKKACNNGVVDSLNLGINQAKGEYIARMDADDISLPSRISKQVELMESNKQIVVCGTGHYFMNYKDDDYREVIPLANDNDIKKQMSMYSPINAGTAMYRAEVIRRVGCFSIEDTKAEGFSMLTKLKNTGVFGNVCEPLYVYYLRGDKHNRSASDGFVGRNKAMVDMVSRSSDKYKLRSWLFVHVWSIYRYVPKPIISLIRPFVSKKNHRKLSKQEIQTLSIFFD
jgi:glycosyltransferase involved in cell wall biosynthesis